MKGPGLLDDDMLHLDRGTNEDAEAGKDDRIEAGAAIGDREMDDNSDRRGTGEHLTAGKEPRVRPNQDRGCDRVVGPGEAGLGTTDEQIAPKKRGQS
jgi:hypothetical protein